MLIMTRSVLGTTKDGRSNDRCQNLMRHVERVYSGGWKWSMSQLKKKVPQQEAQHPTLGETAKQPASRPLRPTQRKSSNPSLPLLVRRVPDCRPLPTSAPRDKFGGPSLQGLSCTSGARARLSLSGRLAITTPRTTTPRHLIQQLAFNASGCHPQTKSSTATTVDILKDTVLFSEKYSPPSVRRRPFRVSPRPPPPSERDRFHDTTSPSATMVVSLSLAGSCRDAGRSGL